MAVIDMTLKQHAVIEILNVEGKKLNYIQEHLKNDYGDTTVDILQSDVFLCPLMWSALVDINVWNLGTILMTGYSECTCHPPIAATQRNIRWVDIISADCTLTMDELWSMLCTSKGWGMVIIKHMGYLNVCAPWVLTQLSDMHKEALIINATTLLHCYNNEGEGLFLSQFDSHIKFVN